MTYLSTATTTGCRWSIGSLSSIWDDDNYQEAVICTDPNHPAGSSLEPSGILDRQWPPTNGSVYNTPSQDFATGLNANTTYTLYGYAKASNGLWYPAGSASITTAKEQLATPYLDAYGSTISGITIFIAPVAHANRYYATCNGQTQNNATGDFAWSGLNPNAQYQVDYYAVDTTGNYLDSAHAYGYISTQVAVRPDPFDWTYAGCDVFGTPVAGSAKSSSYRLHVTAAEWNALIQKCHRCLGL